MEPRESAQQALFISRAGADADFAAVIGGILEAAGYTVVLQQWDFANRNFMERMHTALAEGARVVALLSPEYLRSDHCQAEWQNAIAGDPLNTKSRLILLRVVECEAVGLLSGLAYWDLVPIRDNRLLLEDIVRGAVREDRRDTVPSGPYWRAPRTIVDAEAIRPVPSFSGREEELATLSASLAGGSGIAVVCGLGGVGKSSLAREYAWRNREQYSLIWWLNAQTEDAMIDGLLRVGALFVRGLDQLADRRAAAQQVTSSLLSGFPKLVLLIFDNLEDERLLRTWCPRTGSHALVTSRNAAWGADIMAIALHIWPLETAVEYLQRESGRTDLMQADAQAIVEALGGLPLALAHAAASLRGVRMATPQRYLERISEHLKNAPRAAEYPRSVFATFSTAIVQAEHEAAGAAAVLCFASSFAPDAIPDELFRQRIDLYPEGLQPMVSDGAALDLRSALADELCLDEALGALDRLSLLAFSDTSRTYGIHRLVQLAARGMVVADSLAWTECAVAVADAAFPEVALATWPQCERLLPHARAALDALSGDGAYLPAGRLAHRSALYLQERAEYDAASSLQARALAILEKALVPEHVEVASSLHGLASVNYYQGHYGEAELLLRRTLAIQEEALGAYHPEVATTLSDLAVLCHRKGQYEEVESMHKRALAIREKALGPEDPAVALSLSNLEVFYDWQGRYEEAELLQTRALAIREKVLGPDHPDVATSLNNLAKLYYRQGRYEGLEPVLVRALVILEKALGPDHPDVAYTLNNLAVLYCREGRYAEAEPLNARALRIREKALGPNHPEVATTLSDLAQLHEAQGRFKEAESLHARALELRQRIFGPDHTDVATSLNDVARMHAAQGRFEEAELLYVRASTIREKALGRDHDLTKAVHEELRELRSR